MNKLKNIEFLRVFLISVIVLLHTTAYGSWSLLVNFPKIKELDFFHKTFIQGNNSVEGFFIIAGFLLIFTLKDQSVFSFIKKKYMRLSPTILFAVIICIIASLWHAVKLRFWDDILVVLLLNNFGICLAHGTTPTLWFTSALFAGLLIYFLLTKISSKTIKAISFVALPILAYGILEYFQHGSFSTPHKNYAYIFNVGFLRAVGGVGIGTFVGHIYKKYIQKIRGKVFNFIGNIIINLAELSLLCFMVWWLATPHKQLNCIIFVIAFALLLTLFVFEKGIISKLTNKDIWVKLGKYQYSIYVIHSVVGKILINTVWKTHPEFVKIHPYSTIVIIICAILIAGYITYNLVEKPCTKFLKSKFG